MSAALLCATMSAEFDMTTRAQSALLARAVPHALAATQALYAAEPPLMLLKRDEKSAKREYRRAIVNRWKSDPQMIALAQAAYDESPKKFIFVAPIAWLLGQAVTAVFSWLVWRVLDYLWAHRNNRLLAVAAQEVAP